MYFSTISTMLEWVCCYQGVQAHLMIAHLAMLSQQSSQVKECELRTGALLSMNKPLQAELFRLSAQNPD